MMPGGEPFHDGASKKLQVLQARDVFGVEDVGEGGQAGGELAGAGCGGEK
jgi:hypothetical protein